MMSSLPSLSQSMKPAPPLIDSMTYLLSGEEICETVKPACLATSSNRGVGRLELGACAQAAEQNSRMVENHTLRMEKRYGSTVKAIERARWAAKRLLEAEKAVDIGILRG